MGWCIVCKRVIRLGGLGQVGSLERHRQMSCLDESAAADGDKSRRAQEKESLADKQRKREISRKKFSHRESHVPALMYVYQLTSHVSNHAYVHLCAQPQVQAGDSKSQKKECV